MRENDRGIQLRDPDVPSILWNYRDKRDKCQKAMLTDKTLHIWYHIYSPETKHNLIVPQVSVIVDRKDSFRLDSVKWKKSIIQTISWSFYNLRRYIESIF